MKKSAIVLFAALLSISAFAQNVQEGVNHLYAERYQSAKTVFEKLVGSNPNNIEANYWLGQTHIRAKDTAAAVALYQKLIAANGNAPLALVGMGQIDLMQGRTAEAKQKFETAISLSKGKKGNDPNVLLAVGRANTDAKGGDIAYAIQKLNEASQLAPENADVLLALGNAYRKVPGSGSQAATAYLRSVGLKPTPLAYYRLAKLYSTQQNWDVVVENLDKALSVDPKFAPAFSDLYDYHVNTTRDFAKAEEFANKFMASADPSLNNERMKADISYLQKKYDEAIASGKSIIERGGEKAPPKVYKLVAYSYIAKGDSASARPFVDQYFAKEDPENIIGFDYILQADAYASSNPEIVKEAYLKAAKLDSVLVNQIKVLNQGIERFRNSGHRTSEADLRLLAYQLRMPNANPAELFQIGHSYYYGRQFQKADSLYTAYAAALPDSVYGYFWSGRARHQLDTTLEQGLAIPSYEKTLEVAARDKARLKSQGFEAALYLAGYHNNIKKDKETAVTYLKRALEFDPTNASIQKNIEALTQATAPKPAAPKSTPPKTRTTSSSNSAKSGTKK